MAHIHHTTMTPGKLDLLSAWLPTRPWFAGTAPQLAKAGGFRIDDPAGEVGIEVLVVTDASGAEVVPYLVPMTYRATALAGAEAGLIGTSEHGVLGPRFLYDAPHDPVFVAQLLALFQGDVVAQHQNISDTPDLTVAAVWDAAGRVAMSSSSVLDTTDATRIAVSAGPSPLTLEVVRRPGGSAADDPTAAGRIAATWQLPDGTAQHAAFFAARVG